eukprot:s646_g3.t1
MTWLVPHHSNADNAPWSPWYAPPAKGKWCCIPRHSGSIGHAQRKTVLVSPETAIIMAGLEVVPLVPGAVQSAVAKSGKGAVQGAVQGLRKVRFTGLVSGLVTGLFPAKTRTLDMTMCVSTAQAQSVVRGSEVGNHELQILGTLWLPRWEA